MEQNKQYKYNEFIAEIDGEGNVIEKMPTKRKSVVIYPHEAEWHNERKGQTKMYYELAKQKSEKSIERIAMEKEANDLGVTFMKNIGDVKLQEKIDNVKNQ